MHPSKLYIIGNGFDLAHGIRSRYRDFENFVADTDSRLHTIISKYFDPDFFWSDLEAALASLDVDTLEDEASDFFVSYGAEDWSDACHHDYSYEIDQVVNLLSKTLKSRFTEWVLQLQIPAPGNVRKYNIDRSATFLNFNYTPTLTTLYGIAPAQVLHIHNAALDPGDGLILGHGWQRPDRWASHSPEEMEQIDSRVLEGESLIADYFQRTFKPTDQIIEQHRLFFDALKGLQSVYVAGHSMAKVDFKYFQAIAQTITISQVPWTVSYHSDADIERCSSTFASLGISRDLVQFRRLDDF